MRKRFAPCLTVVLCLLPSLAGCAAKPSEVSGKVSLDDKPIDDGEIIFEALDSKSNPVAGKINGGYYNLAMLPGPKRVRINASKTGGKIDPVMGTAPLESIVPKQFNVESKLTTEVKAGKHEGLDFNLKSKS